MTLLMFQMEGRFLIPVQYQKNQMSEIVVKEGSQIWDLLYSLEQELNQNEEGDYKFGAVTCETGDISLIEQNPQKSTEYFHMSCVDEVSKYGKCDTTVIGKMSPACRVGKRKRFERKQI